MKIWTLTKKSLYSFKKEHILTKKNIGAALVLVLIMIITSKKINTLTVNYIRLLMKKKII